MESVCIHNNPRVIFPQIHELYSQNTKAQRKLKRENTQFLGINEILSHANQSASEKFSSMMLPSSRVQNSFNGGNVKLFGHCTHDRLSFLSVLEEEHYRYSLDLIVFSHQRVTVCIQDIAVQLSSIVPCNFVYYPVDHPAWTAPARVEFYQHWRFAFQDRVFPRTLCNFSCCTQSNKEIKAT